MEQPLAKVSNGYYRNQAVQHRPVGDPVAELFPAGHSAVPGLLHWPALRPCLPCLHHDNLGFRVQGLDIGTPYAQATVRQTRSLGPMIQSGGHMGATCAGI